MEPMRIRSMTFTSPLEHPTTLLQALQDMREEETLCDVTLVCDSLRLPAHKILLAASSRYFKNILSGGGDEEVVLADMSSKAVKAVLDYMYTSEIHITQENFEDVTAAARQFQLSNLLNSCMEYKMGWEREVRHFVDVTYPTRLLHNLHTLQLEKGSCDVTLVVEDREIVAHRVVLAACSDYFRAMFTLGMREATERRVELKDVPYTRLKEMVEYIYTSDIALRWKSLEETVDVASRLQVLPVLDVCSEFLKASIVADTCMDIYQLASVYYLTDVTTAVNSYILEHFQAFCKNADFLELSVDQLAQVLKSDSLNCAAEIDIFWAVYRWLMHESSRIAYTGRLLQHVRFPLMTTFDLNEIVDLEIFKNSLPYKDLMIEAYNYHSHPSAQPLLLSERTHIRSTCHCLVSFNGRKAGLAHREDEQTDVMFLDPNTKMWRDLTATKEPITHQGVAVLNNFVYLIGGEGVRGFRSAVATGWRYDPQKNDWYRVKCMRHRRSDYHLQAMDGKLYAIGGRNLMGENDKAECYNPTKDEWSHMASVGIPLYGHAGTAHKGQLYLSGGGSNWVYNTALRCYDPQSDTWEIKSDMAIARAFHRMATVGGKIFVLGGAERDDHANADVLLTECYSPETGQWSVVAPMPKPQAEPGLAIKDGRIFLVGGSSCQHRSYRALKYIQCYDPTTNKWTEEEPLPDAWTGVACAAITLPQDSVSGSWFDWLYRL
ncbi:kelch-like protein 9 [Branchiostoma floridae x Branchiostoma japonicum]